MPTYRTVIFYSEEVNCMSTGNTLLGQYTNEEHDVEMYPLLAGLSIIEQNGLTTPATVSIGTNSPNYDNILPATLVGLLNIPMTPQLANAAPVEDVDVYARVSIAAGGIVNPSLTIRAFAELWERIIDV